MLDDVHDRILRIYLKAKDESRPHLFAEAFAPDATFVSLFEFETDFSDEAPRRGLEAITETFRGLGRSCENIVTRCTQDSVESTANTMTCQWVVGMTERDDGRVRVAWGDYAWTFSGTRATELVVRMKHMAVLPPKQARAVLSWLSALPAPWCTSQQLLQAVPHIDDLQSIATDLGR